LPLSGSFRRHDRHGDDVFLFEVGSFRRKAQGYFPGRCSLTPDFLKVGSDGLLLEINFSSGHYKPKYEHYLRLYKWFEENQLNVSSVKWDSKQLQTVEAK